LVGNRLEDHGNQLHLYATANCIDNDKLPTPLINSSCLQ
jgi:hypothetical protein